MATIENRERKQAQRCEEFAKHGIEAFKGHYLGEIQLPAKQAAKVLKMLAQNKKEEMQSVRDAAS